MDPQSPTPAATNGYVARRTRSAHPRMYAMQVRAFLEASEVVDADPDTIEDIIDGFDEETFNAEEDPEGEDGDVQDTRDGAANGVDAVDEYVALLEEGMSCS